MPPLIPPLAVLAAGIFAAPLLDLRYAAFAALLAALVSLARPRFVLALLFLLGAGLRTIQATAPPAIPDDGYASRITARLERPVESRPPGYYLTVRVLTVDGAPWSGRARLSFFPDDGDAERMFHALELGSGDEISVLVRLTRPRTYRNPGVFDYRGYLERRGVFWTGSIRSPRLLEVDARGWHGPDRLRQWASGRIAAHFEPGSTVQALVLGMVLGQRQRLPGPDRERFEQAGLIHLLVVSGFNLALVAAAGLQVGRWLPLGPRRRTGRYAFALAVVLAYTFVVEGEASVARAAVMALILITARLLDRGYSRWNTLAAAAGLILLLDPLAPWDPGFQLTFGAVLAIVGLGVPALAAGGAITAPGRLDDVAIDGRLDAAIADRRVALRLRCELHGLPPGAAVAALRAGAFAREAAWITFAVQAALFPLTIESYHRASVAAVPLNVLGAAAAALVTPAGLLLLALPAALGAPLAWLIEATLRGLTAAVEFAVALPGGSLAAPSPPGWLWGVYGLGVGLMGVAAGRRSRRLLAASASGVIAAQAAIVWIDFSGPPPAETTVTFLDVGQGDSVVVQLTDGRIVLVDAGGSPLEAWSDSEGPAAFSIGEDVVSAYLFRQRLRRIDIAVVTHAHADHMGGFFDVIRNFEVGELWVGVNPPSPAYQRLLEAAAAREIPVRHVRAGDDLPPFRVLNPPERAPGREVRNDDSIVLRLDDGASTALLTGDYEGTLPGLGPIHLLKAPHHGGRNVRLRVSAPIRVISVGANNSYGHPHASHLPALRTDLLGAIRVHLRPGRPEIVFPARR